MRSLNYFFLGLSILAIVVGITLQNQNITHVASNTDGPPPMATTAI